MRAHISSALLLVTSACAPAVVAPAPVAPAPAALAPANLEVPSDPTGVARALANELAARDFARAVLRFDERLATALSADSLAKQWDGMVSGFGGFKQVSVLRVEGDRAEGAQAVYVECSYEHDSLTIVVVVDGNRKVTGLRPASPHKREDYARSAKDLLDLLVAREWAKSTASFAPEMLKALPAEQLAKVFEAFRADAGDRREVVAVRVQPTAQGAIVDLECAFEKKSSVVRVTFDGKLRVAGLFFKPAWSPPDYSDARSFDERSVTIGTSQMPLPGTLSMPKGKGPFPVLVLVHGSGPNDQDETSGPNKIFKDLAWGLASRNVAVFRFVKRTEQYRGKPSGSGIRTVKEESIDDVRTAVDLLEKTPGIDPKRIVVAGHSLGAMLAPRIADGDPRVHAIVLLAGPTRSEGQIRRDQTRYLVGPWGWSQEEAAKKIRDADAMAERLDASDLKPDEIVDGIEGRYWLDMREHHGARVVGRLSVPVLVLQGARDYQVTLADLEGWKKALAGKANATFKVYPDLNHLFMAGKGPLIPKEYSIPGHVPRYVVEDIAAWVGSR